MKWWYFFPGVMLGMSAWCYWEAKRQEREASRAAEPSTAS